MFPSICVIYANALDKSDMAMCETNIFQLCVYCFLGSLNCMNENISLKTLQLLIKLRKQQKIYTTKKVVAILYVHCHFGT